MIVPHNGHSDAQVLHGIIMHPAWDRVDGLQWAGATRTEMIEVVAEALHDALFSPERVGDGSPKHPWNGNEMPRAIKALRRQIRGCT